MTIGSTGSSEVSLARALARTALAVDLGRFDADVIAKAKICLLDFLSCAFEARNHPWSRQAIGIAREVGNGATVIGTRTLASPGDAAFANATMGHGLVREDMHAASICHHGVVIWPTLLALSERTPLSGATFLAAAIIGYETGAQIGRALFNADLARLYRPTGLVAPLGAALAGSYALGLSEDAATSAMAIAANTSSGLNEWPRAGGSEMYFHPGFAARNAIAAIELAEAGARASETILEGEAGLFAAFRRQPAPTEIRLFAGAEPEIMAVYNKPAPACNFAQTAAQTALRVARELGTSEDIATVSIRVPDAAARYPGCDSKGPFHNALQAKMSIPFSVAAVLARGALEEENYARCRRYPDSSPRRTDRSAKRPRSHRRVPGQPGRRDPRWPAQRKDHPSAPRQCHCRHARRNPRPLSAGGFRRHRRQARADLEDLVDNCASLPDSRVIAARCRLEPTEQRLRPAS